jgi:hypothetical protein
MNDLTVSKHIVNEIHLNKDVWTIILGCMEPIEIWKIFCLCRGFYCMLNNDDIWQTMARSSMGYKPKRPLVISNLILHKLKNCQEVLKFDDICVFRSITWKKMWMTWNCEIIPWCNRIFSFFYKKEHIVNGLLFWALQKGTKYRRNILPFIYIRSKNVIDNCYICRYVNVIIFLTKKASN